jgi:hypothetical protein
MVQRASPGKFPPIRAGAAQEQRGGLFQDFEARSDVKYKGQRAGGTYAFNGTIHLEARSEDFQCSDNTAGDTMVESYAVGKSQSIFVKGGGSPYISR